MAIGVPTITARYLLDAVLYLCSLVGSGFCRAGVSVPVASSKGDPDAVFSVD